MRGSVYLVIDSVEKAHATRRQLIEKLNFGPTVHPHRRHYFLCLSLSLFLAHSL